MLILESELKSCSIGQIIRRLPENDFLCVKDNTPYFDDDIANAYILTDWSDSPLDAIDALDKGIGQRIANLLLTADKLCFEEVYDLELLDD